MNLPWLAFVNISFAVMILLRHVLLNTSDPLYPHSPQLTKIVDASMLGIIILSAALILMAWRRIAGISVVLFICSAIWSVSCFWFITHLLLLHVWPLCVILLLAGLTALYFYPEGLLACAAALDHPAGSKLDTKRWSQPSSLLSGASLR
jgi:hypothetical protein